MTSTTYATDQAAGYNAFSRLLHWLTVLLFIAVYTLTYVWHGPDHSTLLALHKSFGITILALTLIRLGHWLVIPRPKLLPAPNWQHAIARLSHFLLYVVMLGQPALGWASSMMGNHPVNFYLMGPLPSFLPSDKQLGDELIDIHADMKYVILALIAIHVCAALYHHVAVRDRTLTRMISGS